MKKKSLSFIRLKNIFKKNREMKLSFLLFVFALLNLQANDAYSQNKKISLKVDNKPIEQVLEQIELDSRFIFFYKTDEIDVSRKISVNVVKTPIKDLLGIIFNDGSVRYTVLKNQIVLKKSSFDGLPLQKEIKEESEEFLVQQTITGLVVDENNQPLPGANVLEKGTTRGTQADFDGNFTINITDENAILVVSYIGFKTREITVGNQTELTIIMEASTAGLEEVVVIGYGTQKEALLTGSVGIVSSKEIKKVSYANSTGVLQGRVPGVKVETNGGAPGAGINVEIRGTGSFGNDQPLYVVDGNIIGSMSFINPNDIESISVLKDASAAAIYGSRAANGVVLITTKKGSIGDVQINFETKIGFQNPTSYLDFMNAREYADFHNMAKDNDGDARAIPNDTGFDPSIDTDWQDLSLNSALYQEYNLNVSGGNENAQFYISSQYLDQEGIVVDSGFKRYNLTANANFNKGIFSMSQSLLLSRAESNPNNFFIREGAAPPTIPVYDENNEGGFAGVDPNLHGVARGINWYGRAILHDNLITTDRLVASLQPKLQLSKNLIYQLNLGLDYSVGHNYAFQPTFFQSTSQEASESIASLNESYVRSVSSLIENTLQYSNNFGKHGVTLLLGYTQQSIRARSAGGVGTNFIFNDFRVLDAADDNTDNTTGNLQENSLTSYLGRINYDYSGKYILSATIRRDGSSRFTEVNRWGVFPSASVGWRISKEDFFPQDGFVSNLKFRGSYGMLGSQNIGNYQTSSVLNTSNFYNLGGAIYGGSIVTNLANPNLKWETTKILNYGLDAELLDGRISFSVEYYKKRSEDILVNVPIPIHGGLGRFLTSNAATIDNKGFEFGGTYRHIAENDGLNFDVTLNFNTLKNEVIALGDGVNALSGGSYTQGGF